MAQSARKSPKKAKGSVLEDEKLLRHERLTLILYLEVGLALIAGMVVLSEFLSQGKASRPVWITAAVLGGIAALGFLTTFLLRRRGDRKA